KDSVIRLALPAMIGLIFGMSRVIYLGLLAVMWHWAARLLLACQRRTPYRWLRFLEDMNSRHLLRRIGGGYAFTHSSLLEHFVSMPAEPGIDQQAPIASDEARRRRS